MENILQISFEIEKGINRFNYNLNKIFYLEKIIDVVKEHGYSSSINNLFCDLGIDDILQLQTYGLESLSQEDINNKVIFGCENFIQKWKDNIIKFFKWIIEKIKELWTKIIKVFNIEELRHKNIREIYNSLKDDLYLLID